MRTRTGLTQLSLVAALGAAAIAACPASALAATAQRTFVRSDGSDANPCSLALPCRSFNAAIAQTSPGGEVVILNTAGYGPMTIDKSIKIIGPSGIYGGISALGAGINPTTGIVINAGDTDVITLRGLDIAGVPTSAPFPDAGIDIQNAGSVHIEKSSISNFTQDTSDCIRIVSAKAIQVFVNDSFLRECRTGIYVIGNGADDSSRVNLVVDNTRIEHGINTTSTGTSAVNLNKAVVASLRNSVLSWAGDGLRANNINTAVNLRAFVIGSQFSRFGNAAIETVGTAGASVHVNASTSVFNNNGAGLLHGHGQAIFSSNVISNNTNSLVDCGGGAANVTSLGYGGGNGSNSVYNNTDTVLPAGCTAWITPTQFQGK